MVEDQQHEYYTKWCKVFKIMKSKINQTVTYNIYPITFYDTHDYLLFSCLFKIKKHTNILKAFLVSILNQN